MKTIILTEKTEKIEWRAFGFNDNLEEIYLSEILKEIDNEAFLNCKNLKKLLIPSTCLCGIEFAKANGIPYEEI